MPPENTFKVVTATSENDYPLLEHAFYGSGGFNDASYLIQHEREVLAKYQRRQKLAYYLNYTKPLVNAHVNPIFRKAAVRDTGSNEAVYQQFLKDVDGGNTPLHRFVKYAATLAKLKGCIFIAIDTPKEQPLTKAAVIEERAFPYCFLIDPAAVKEYYITKTGKLLYFSYIEPDEQDSTKMNTRVWTPYEWQLQNDGGDIIDRGENPIGRVPIVQFRASVDKPTNLLPQSEFMPVAQTNKQLFNRCSWLDEILIGQAFSLFLYPSTQPVDLTIGVNNAIGFDGEKSHFAPSFVAPSSEPANMIMAKIDMLIAEMYRMAGASNVTGVKEALSGKAKQWDYESLNNTLSDFAYQCQYAETDIVKLYGLWTNQVINYSVTYPTDFAITDVTAELDNALKAQTLRLGAAFDKVIVQKILTAYAPGVDDKTKKDILAEAEQMAIDKINAEKVYNDDETESESETESEE